MEWLAMTWLNASHATRMALFLAAYIAWAIPTAFAGHSVPVLLTFDVEDDRGALLLKELQVSEPSTFFLTGQFVERHKRMVAELAREHTIGSHSYSHAHLTQLNPVELRKELLLTKMLLEEVTGSAPQWFRAPFLEYNQQVMEVLKELGFRYDSSGQERWTQQMALLEIPVSSRDRSDQLVSDYDIFVREKMTDANALKWLKERYLERKPTGRPLVFLMHPTIIGLHKQVLFEFMAFVRGQGGYFLSSDQWIQRAFAHRPAKLGVWVDLSLGEHDPGRLVEDVRGAGITDVFLMARDPEGNDFFLPKGRAAEAQVDLFGVLVTSLRQAGVRVHAWLPTFRNPYLAQLDPRLAMVAENGAVSTDWVSPFHPEVRQALLDTAAWLLRNYDLQGIHLDYLRYPGLGLDFSPRAIAGFAKAHGLEGITPARAQKEHYNLWMDWRVDQIAGFTRQMREILQTFGTQGAELSAALIAGAAVSYRARDQYGQDYARLAPYLDVVIPMAYIKEERKPPEWIAQVLAAARYRVGDTPVFTGLAAYQKPGQWSLSGQQLEQSIGYARRGSDGIVFYPYLHLFSRGSNGWDMPAGSADALRLAVASTASESTVPPETLVSPASEPNEVELDQQTRVLGTENTQVYLIALLSVLLAGFVWLATHRGRGKTAAGPPGIPSRPVFSAGTSDWKSVEGALGLSPISKGTYHTVFNILRFMGATKIAAFRIARILDALAERSRTTGQLLTELQGRNGEDPRYLRYIEECVLLGYARMSGEFCQITAAGAARLEQSEALGYSREFLAFVEQRLGEKLVLSCPYCCDNTLGHWFWKDVECSSCGKGFDVDESPRIHVHVLPWEQAVIQPSWSQEGKVPRIHTVPDDACTTASDLNVCRTSSRFSDRKG